jgi:hypothetical protein
MLWSEAGESHDFHSMNGAQTIFRVFAFHSMFSNTPGLFVCRELSSLILRYVFLLHVSPKCPELIF